MKPKKHPVLQIIPPQKTKITTKEKITRLLTSLVPFCFFEADYMAMNHIKPYKNIYLRLFQALKTRIQGKREIYKTSDFTSSVLVI
jgi:uncharacterized protein YutD